MFRHIGSFILGIRARANVAGISGRTADRGSALLETAIVMPVILLMMTGIFTFSVALYQKEALGHGVSTASRYMATRAGVTDPCADTASVLYAAAPALSPSRITLSFVFDGVAYSGATCSGTTHLVSGKTAQITATYPCSLSWFGSGGTIACSLRESITEVVQ